MTEGRDGAGAARAPAPRGYQSPYQSAIQQGRPQPATLADILERVLDKGVIIAGDIRINLLDIELLTIKIRLLLVSVDKAEEMGIDWWRHDPMLTVRERREDEGLREENRQLRERLEALEAAQHNGSGGSEVEREDRDGAGEAEEEARRG